MCGCLITHSIEAAWNARLNLLQCPQTHTHTNKIYFCIRSYMYLCNKAQKIASFRTLNQIWYCQIFWAGLACCHLSVQPADSIYLKENRDSPIILFLTARAGKKKSKWHRSVDITDIPLDFQTWSAFPVLIWKRKFLILEKNTQTLNFIANASFASNTFL